ncbi:2-isopropylmalate synthase [Ochrobactrum sp. 30A/1000/2015]|uniref:2-isopropylmalate synthase n=1 Tax=Brucella intermedia M86 TaxID=1234597 RepID=M5JM03_9HYPH|nr:2-isopropylmalate synthase [Brucella intermedia M86]KAB2693261.1 2-isopropylmalate synthase [Brucella intermedia]PJT23626.1 2-isopropylmalate synthase [Ochrobactrum sp. 30A/1000/2015]PJT38136.1 2-isopropylmalate synthase [Ochrobactrum sp. 27A/999/2015]PJT41667.1 2-isopropylmalate synthase [Ochrobactrum sp. 23A/997/2015]
MARERIYIYDTTLRDGQQTVTVRPQLRSVRGRNEVEAGGCCAARMQGAE